MPASDLSLRLTDGYRARLAALRMVALRRTTVGWQALNLDDLDRSYGRWLDATVAALEAVQARGVRLVDGYLAAYMTAELATGVGPRGLDPAPYVGVSRDGRPLVDALLAPLLTVRREMSVGVDTSMAMRSGLARAVRAVGLDAMHAPRAAQTAAMASDDRILGWRRVARPDACLACLGAADGEIQEDPIQIHAKCDCAMEPVVAGVRERAMRPTGRQSFDAMGSVRQDRRYGEKAELIRSGQVPLEQFVAVSPMATEADWLTEAPLSALT